MKWQFSRAKQFGSLTPENGNDTEGSFDFLCIFDDCLMHRFQDKRPGGGPSSIFHCLITRQCRQQRGLICNNPAQVAPLQSPQAPSWSHGWADKHMQSLATTLAFFDLVTDEYCQQHFWRQLASSLLRKLTEVKRRKRNIFKLRRFELTAGYTLRWNFLLQEDLFISILGVS